MSYNIVYAKLCKKENCRSVYSGETKRLLKFCIADHCGYVINKETTQATGSHLNLPGHTLADLQVSCIEIVTKNITLYRKIKEASHLIRLDSIYQVINRK